MSLINKHITLPLLVFLCLNINEICPNLQINWYEDYLFSSNTSYHQFSQEISSLPDDMNVESSAYILVKDPRLYYFDPPLICEGRQAEKLAMASIAWSSRKMQIRQVGKLKNMFGRNLCLSYPSNQSKDSMHRVTMKYCTKFHDHQVWKHTINGKIRQKGLCLEYSSSQRSAYVDLCRRDSENQHWFYNPRTSLLHHIGTDKCLGLKRLNSRPKLTLVDCCKNLHSPLARWHMVNIKSIRKYK